MKLKLSEAAEFVGGKLTGKGDLEITGFAKIEEANEGDLTFLYLPHYEKFFSHTKASAIVVKPDFEKIRSDISYIEVPDPNKAFFKILRKYFYPEFPLYGIDPSAYVHPSAVIGENTALGKNVVISEGCRLGSNVKIFHNTVILNNAVVDDNTIIFPNVSVREECRIGKRCIIHSGTVIGSDGFGFFPDEKGAYQKIPQIGIVIIEDDVELGSNVSVDRASLGATIIRKGVKIDNLVQVAHNVVIGENTVISSQSGISGSTTVGSNCMIAGQVGIVGHISIADNVILMAQSGVAKGIPKAGSYFGSPAKDAKTAMKIIAHIGKLPDYAEQIRKMQEQINKLQEEIDKIK